MNYKSLVILLSSAVISGCATTGQGAGTGIGAVVGGLVTGATCKMTGGSNCTEQALIGAAAGALAGNLYGRRQDQIMASYKNDLEAVQTETQYTKDANVELAKQQLEAEAALSKARSDYDRIAAKLATKKEKEKEFVASRKAAENQLNSLREQKKNAEKVLDDEKFVLAEIRKGGDAPPAEVAKLEKEIKTLESTVAKFARTEEELASTIELAF